MILHYMEPFFPSMTVSAMLWADVWVPVSVNIFSLTLQSLMSHLGIRSLIHWSWFEAVLTNSFLWSSVTGDHEFLVSGQSDFTVVEQARFFLLTARIYVFWNFFKILSYHLGDLFFIHGLFIITLNILFLDWLFIWHVFCILCIH